MLSVLMGTKLGIDPKIVEMLSFCIFVQSSFCTCQPALVNITDGSIVHLSTRG